MLKKLSLGLVILSVQAFAAAPPTSPSDRSKIGAYAALTAIISADTPPPVSKAAAIADEKNRPHEVLAELCFYAGGIYLKLNKLTQLHPQSQQVPEPARTQMQTFVGLGQDLLRNSCGLSDANSKLTVHQRIAAVRSAIADVQTESIKLRSSLRITSPFSR